MVIPPRLKILHKAFFRNNIRCHHNRSPIPLSFSPEVAEAKRLGKPIVALESTIISHGMPYPQNLVVARELESIVRSKGVVPATIAIMEGVPCIGLTDEQLQTLAKDQKTVVKASTRDLAYVIATKKTGATTVASTMRLAHMAGIKIFATGGLGGVHPGGESTMDISTDLIELGRTPVAIVCAGIKSILDISRSLEVLETQGVPVVGYETDVFPAFFTNHSGFKVHARADSAEDAARILQTQFQVAGDVGAVIAVPNPQPADGEQVSKAIQQALQEAEDQHITGNAITPFLLERIEQLTEGQSLKANIALVKHNVDTACDIALLLEKYPRHSYQTPVSSHSKENTVPTITCSEAGSENSRTRRDVVVVGGATVDIISSVSLPVSVDGDSRINGVYHAGASNPGIVRQSFGGVGRNVAAHLAAQGAETALMTCWTNDSAGNALAEDCRHRCRIDTSFVSTLTQDDNNHSSSPLRTAVYNAIHTASGELIAGVADMDIFQHISPRYLQEHVHVLESSRAIVCDANISVEAFQSIADLASSLNKPLFFEPTSDHKCVLPLKAKRLQEISLLKPNASELQCMLRFALDNCSTEYPHIIWNNIDILLREAASEEFCACETQRHDVETLSLLSATLMDLMNTTPVSLCSHHSHHSTSLAAKNNNGMSLSDKHVLVSLGSQGLLWTAPKSHFEEILPGGKAMVKDGVQLRVEGFDLRTLLLTPNYLSVHLVGDKLESADLICSNGAGDALFAAVIRSMLQHSSDHGEKLVEGKEVPRPTIQDIVAGMDAARRRLVGLDVQKIRTDGSELDNEDEEEMQDRKSVV